MTAIRTTTTRTTITPSDAPGGGSSSPELAILTLEALFDAYFDCRKHKRNSQNQLAYEMELERNTVQLWRDLEEGRYEIGRSIAFVVTHPKIREIWAADFRDRVVHHLVYNAIRPRFEKSFIRDAYACIPGRGIHDGMRRVSHFARSVTQSWSRPAYAMKADIANFFNSIDNEQLIHILKKRIHEKWVMDLIEQIIHHNPRPDVIRQSTPEMFALVPKHKSFMHAPPGKGLPIGNLTSQFFANVYLNELDQFVKHKLKARYYGRYVDDIILFHEDAGALNGWYDEIENFLYEKLKMRLHPHKKWLNRADAGIDFVGFVIKPGRTYLRQASLSRCQQKIRAWEKKGAVLDEHVLDGLSASLNSYLGMLRQVDGYNARKSICNGLESLFIRADEGYTKIFQC
ncbi:Retron-type reverse transcriptase [Desulfosarcina cetonica]|uniref:RNA-directed DNA polymerase n=1 Tax=Desulfosarcina cetonica TaxID=90730 RepID=UPI00155D8DF3|nr:RNA-directed DNA polymerase [Desulfosarcina cetonica]VTR64402.1 Retron-type reverse transcriptase [Desulfosarcina cetonica]